MTFKRTDLALSTWRKRLLYSSGAFAICFLGLVWGIGGSELLNLYQRSFENPPACILHSKSPYSAIKQQHLPPSDASPSTLIY